MFSSAFHLIGGAMLLLIGCTLHILMPERRKR